LPLGSALGAACAGLGGHALKEQDIKRIEAHLKRTFGNPHINLKPRPKQKDSAEVYMDQEFIGVIYEDEDEDGSFLFEMAILEEDLA
jgi:hypothetical protein